MGEGFEAVAGVAEEEDGVGRGGAVGIEELVHDGARFAREDLPRQVERVGELA